MHRINRKLTSLRGPKGYSSISPTLALENIITDNQSIQDIHNYMSVHGKVFVFLGEGKHKIKKKAEQIACERAVQALG